MDITVQDVTFLIDLNIIIFDIIFHYLDVLDTYALNPWSDIVEEIILEFCKKEYLKDDQIPEDDDQGSTSTDYSEDEKPNSNYEDGGVTYAYKVKAVSFWKDLPVKKRKGRKTRRSFTCVQAMFKKLRSLNQLYQGVGREWRPLAFPPSDARSRLGGYRGA